IPRTSTVRFHFSSQGPMPKGRRYRIAVLGGTGAQGSALAARLAVAGHEITIGSREAAKAHGTAAQLSARAGKPIAAADNLGAAAAAEIVILTVPYAAQRTTLIAVLDALRGKILVDTTVPLVPPKVSVVQLPEGRSAV